MRFDCIHCRKATTKPQSVKGAFLRMLTDNLNEMRKEVARLNIENKKNKEKIKNLEESIEYLKAAINEFQNMK